MPQQQDSLLSSLTKEFYLDIAYDNIKIIKRIENIDCLVYVCKNLNYTDDHLEFINEVLLDKLSTIDRSIIKQ